MPENLLLMMLGGRYVAQNPATGDIYPPELVSISLFPSTITENGTQTIRVEFQLTDKERP